MLIRSDNVAALTPAGRQAMVDYGVTTVIDLRAASELRGAPGPPFSAFQSFAPAASPIEAGGGIPRHLNLPFIDDTTALRLSDAMSMPARYALMLDHRQAAVGKIFNAIAGAGGPVLFHCFAGKDRTGLVAAMMLSLAGVEPEAIGADYAETDVQLAARYAEWLARAGPDRIEEMRSELRCPPEWILSALAHLERTWGGVDSYLEAAGVTPAAIDHLSVKLA